MPTFQRETKAEQQNVVPQNTPHLVEDKNITIMTNMEHGVDQATKVGKGV